MTLHRQASAGQLTPATCNKRLPAGRWTCEQVDNRRRSSTLNLYRAKFAWVLGDKRIIWQEPHRSHKAKCKQFSWNSPSSIIVQLHWCCQLKFGNLLHKFLTDCTWKGLLHVKLSPKWVWWRSRDCLKFWAKVLISRKWFKIETYFQWKTNRKSYVGYRMAPVLVTLNDLEGHFPRSLPVWRPFQLQSVEHLCSILPDLNWQHYMTNCPPNGRG